MIEQVKVEETKFRTTDGILFDNIESARKWEDKKRKEGLAKRIHECIYGITGSSFLDNFFPHFRDPDWYVAHPITQEHLDILGAYIDEMDADEDMGVHIYGFVDKFEIDKDYIMIFTSEDLYIYTFEKLKQFFLKEVQESCDMIEGQIASLNNIEIWQKKLDLIKKEKKNDKDNM